MEENLEGGEFGIVEGRDKAIITLRLAPTQINADLLNLTIFPKVPCRFVALLEQSCITFSPGKFVRDVTYAAATLRP